MKKHKQFTKIHFKVHSFIIGLTLIFISGLCNTSYAQTTKVTIRVTDKTVQEIISIIEKRTQMIFFYNDNDVDLTRKVSIDAQEKNLTQVLDELFRNTPNTYRIDGRQIFITKRVKQTQENNRTEQKKIKISGFVTDKEKQPVIGAAIVVKGTTIGTITDISGKFNLEVPERGQLLVTFLGYDPQLINIDGKTNFAITLEQSLLSLDEVVVVGYGTQKKSDITGAVASVSKDRIDNSTATDAIQYLQGSVAGLNITATEAGSNPESGAVMLIRGRNSISASNDPLIVLDGVSFYGSLSDINPKDIESIEVLKDASSSAIYGSRAANGVILIETRKGVKGKTTIKYDAFYSMQSVANFPHLMTGDEYVAYKAGADVADEENLPLSASELDVYNSGSYKTWTWRDLILRNGNSMRHDLSLSGGNDKTTYNASLSYLGTNGIVINDKYQRGTSRINIKSEVNKWLTIGNNIMLSYTDNSGAYPSFVDVFNKSPLSVPFNEDGSINIYPIADDPRKLNPIETLLYDDLNKRYAASANNYLNIDLPFIKGFSYRLNTGIQYSSTEKNWYRGSNTNRSDDLKGESQTNSGVSYSLILENIFSYKREFKKHNLFLTGLYSLEEKENKSTIITANGFANDFLSWYGASQASNYKPAYTYTKTDLISQMLRLNYSYNSRYLFTATVRRDGYSGFGTLKKYGTFPSIALGWNIANEKFFSKAKEIVNTLKIRTSYGKSGNQAIIPYQTLSQLGAGDYNSSGTPLPGYIPATLGTAGLGWETTYALNLGLDYGLLGSRISGEINIYKNKTEDLLLKRSISAVHGVNYIYQNIGKTQNKGIEFMINSTNIRTKNFTWSSNLNFTAIDTKIIDLYGDGKDDLANKWFIGKPINVNFDYKFIGVWQRPDSLEALGYGAKPGYARYVDVNKNGVYDPEDRQIIGSPEPTFTWGFTNNFIYKSLSINIFLYGKNNVLKANPYKDRTYLIMQNYWTINNPTNEYWSNASMANKYLGKGNYPSVYENADFVRVKEITIAYNLPQKIFKKINVNTVKLYATGKNLFTFTKWLALDPELDNQRAIPLQREFIGGINLSF